MFKITLGLLMSLILTGMLFAQDDGNSQEELAKKPMHERMLSEDNQKKINDLMEKSEVAEAEDRLSDALKLIKEVISLRTKYQGPDHWEVTDAKIREKTLGSVGKNRIQEWKSIKTIDDKAEKLFSSGEYQKAIKEFEKSLEARRSILGDEEHPETAEDYKHIAVCHDLLGNVKEAAALHERSLSLRQAILGDYHPDTANGYTNYSLNLADSGDMARAKKYALKAIEIGLWIYGESHATVARSYNSMATILYQEGRVKEAIPFIEKSIAVFRKTHGYEHPETVNSQHNLGMALCREGRIEEGVSVLASALDVGRRVDGDGHPLTATKYDGLAAAIVEQGKSYESQSLYKKALDIRKQLFGENSVQVAKSYNNLGHSYSEQGEFGEAYKYFEMASKIFISEFGQDHEFSLVASNNLGFILTERGELQDAEAVLRDSLARRIDLLGDLHPDTARSRGNLADNLLRQGRSLEASVLNQEALSVLRKCLGDGHRDTTSTLLNMALNLVELGRYSDARELLLQAIYSFELGRIYRGFGIERSFFNEIDPRRFLCPLDCLVAPESAWAELELSFARGFYDQRAIVENSFSAGDFELAESYRNELGRISSRIVEIATDPSLSELGRAEVVDLLKKRDEINKEISEISAKISLLSVAAPTEIRSAINRTSGLLFWLDASSRSEAIQEHFACVVRREGDPFWVRLPGSGEGGAWTKADSDLPGRVRDALAKELPPEDIEDMVAALRRQRIEPVLHHLSQHGIDQLLVVGVNQMAGVPIEILAPEFAISYVPSGTFLARLPKKPAYDKSLLAVGDPVYELETGKNDRSAVLPPHGLLVREAVAEGAASKAGIRSGDVLLQYGDRKLESVDELQQSIQDFIDAGRGTIDVVIWRVGVDGFPVEDTVTVPIGPLGVSLSPDPAPKAISDAREADSFFSSIRRGDNWADLPGTRYEVSRISELFPNANVLLDRDASERGIEGLRVSGELSKFRYLHFATHGKGNSKSAFESKLALSQDGEKEEFAQTGSPWMNNEISAREVLDHWKISADLVTLSACESGVGRQGGGDGLLGFAQAFLISGARSVCLSLWNVDDTATALLMHRFYQNLLGKRPGLSSPMTKVAALKEAKEWLRNLSTSDALDAASDLTKGVSRGGRGEVTLKTRIGSEKSIDKPFSDAHYWSAFILVGDPE